MSQFPASQSGSVFGKRTEPHTIIIARGNKISHFVVRPWIAAVVGSIAAAAVIGYLGATTYLVLRDDLIAATVSRQARIQQAYEDRISSLRVQIDRVTSRQLLDQQLMEDKVAELMRRQSSLLERHSQLAPLAERNRKQAALVPVPTRRDGKSDGTAPTAYVTAYATATQIDPIVTGAVADAVQTGESIADRADRTFVAINKRLRELEHDQVQQIVSLTDELLGKASAIKTAAADAGIGLKITGETGTGGPYIPAKAGGAALDAGEFDARLEALDSAYETVDQVTEAVNAYPLASPAPGSPTSSTFGLRKDPFLGTSAMHSGIDFRAATGTPIRATGSGVVTSAGRNGGYGLMVEIDHGNGYSTRYAHMSAIKVREGQKVTVSDVVGLVGSTGRSTGPHLHYEVRMNGEARNPKRYLSAGANIRKFL